MSVKHPQNKQSRSWLGPFAMGLVSGILLTLSVGEWLREQAEESATVAHAALEGDVAERYPARATAPAPVQEPAAAPAVPAAAAVPAPEPESEPQPEQAQPSAAEPAAPQVAATSAPAPTPAAAPAEAAPAPKPASPAASKPPAEPAAAARAPLPAAAPPPAAAPAAPAPIKPAPPAPPVYQDPNSEEAKLAAAAQVRLKGDTKIDNMLDQALTGEKSAPAPSAPASTVLPQTPTREDVVNSMSVIVPAIRGCAQGQSGLAPMSIVVLSDGRVESAALSGGPFQGTASGRCMEGVVRRARFPRFKQANFRVQFPFAVQ